MDLIAKEKYHWLQVPVDNEGVFDLKLWTGRSEQRLPVAYRLPEDSLAYCDVVVAAVGDATCDPRSGGVAGYKHLAAFLGVKDQQARKHIVPDMQFLRWLGDIPVTNVASITAYAKEYLQTTGRKNPESLRILWECSGGSQ